MRATPVEVENSSYGIYEPNSNYSLDEARKAFFDARLNANTTAEKAFANKKSTRVFSVSFVCDQVTQHTTSEGREISYRSLYIGGDGNGLIGFGVGKAEDLKTAAIRASDNVFKNLLYVPLHDSRTLSSRLTGRHNRTWVDIRPGDNKLGLRGTLLATTLLSFCGVTSASVKFSGNRDRWSQVFAMFNALAKAKSTRDAAITAGKSLYRFYDPVERQRKVARARYLDDYEKEDAFVRGVLVRHGQLAQVNEEKKKRMQTTTKYDKIVRSLDSNRLRVRFHDTAT